MPLPLFARLPLTRLSIIVRSAASMAMPPPSPPNVAIADRHAFQHEPAAGRAVFLRTRKSWVAPDGLAIVTPSV
jgi:hypothetical protein